MSLLQEIAALFFSIRCTINAGDFCSLHDLIRLAWFQIQVGVTFFVTSQRSVRKNDVLMMSFIVKPVVNGDSIFQPSDVRTFTGFIATVGGAEKFHGAAL